MNHQPFRDWLVSEEKLTSNQSQQLQEHLADCDACSEIGSAWMELKTTMQKTTQLAPTPGFTARWEGKLAQYHAHRQKQQGMVIVSSMICLIIILSILLVTQFWSILQVPGPYIAAWFSSYLDVFSILIRVKNFLNPFSWNIPVYAFISLFFMVGIASFLSVLWLATYRKLSFARRSL